jgi:hypothetical protein
LRLWHEFIYEYVEGNPSLAGMISVQRNVLQFVRVPPLTAHQEEKKLRKKKKKQKNNSKGIFLREISL